MTKQEKLIKLISLAVENGFELKDKDYVYLPKLYIKGLVRVPHGLLFSHDFAKAIWPGEIVGRGGHSDGEWWAYHLQQAVISKDPLQYYWENKDS